MVEIVHGTKGARLAADKMNIVVVVDALRASATITALFQKGIVDLYVCHDEQVARSLALQMPDALLAGEQNTQKPAGFHLFNSPSEVSKADIKGKTVIFTSTNGAKMLIAARGAAKVMVGGVTNADRISQHLIQYDTSISVVACGDEGVECDEDSFSAAYLAKSIDEQFNSKEMNNWQDEIRSGKPIRVFKESRHGKKLITMGLNEDVVTCASKDIFSVIPLVKEYIFHRGKIVARLQKIL